MLYLLNILNLNYIPLDYDLYGYNNFNDILEDKNFLNISADIAKKKYLLLLNNIINSDYYFFNSFLGNNNKRPEDFFAKFGLRLPANEAGYNIMVLHNLVMYVVVAISAFTIYSILGILSKFSYAKLTGVSSYERSITIYNINIKHSTILETI
jgi:hypothetical protein